MFEQHSRGIKELKADTFGHVFGHLMVRALSGEARNKWKIYSTGSTNPLDLSQVIAFLTERVSTMECDAPDV